MMDRREENEISQLDTRPGYRGGGYGHISRAPGPGQRRVAFISEFVPGPSAIHDKWIEVNGERVTEVAVNTPFDILVSFTAANAAGGIFKAWSCCITVTDQNGLVQNWNRWDTGLSTFANDISRTAAKINKLGQNVMPDRDLNLRIKLWGNDEKTPSPPYPPEEDW